MPAAGVRRPAVSICCNCAGRMAFAVPAVGAERVRRLEPLPCRDCRHQTSVTAKTIFSGHAHFSTVVVSSNVVDDQSEERCQCAGVTTSARVEYLRNGLDVAA